MCMKGTKEECVLIERMTKVEIKQTCIIIGMVAMFVMLAFMTLKMLNAQIFLLTGNDGLRTISVETRSDVKAVVESQKEIKP